MSRERLKIIAMVTMLIDHIGAMGLAGSHWLLFRGIGRLAFPIFAYQIATGFCRTSSKIRYLCTVGAFALISEIPFNLMHGRVSYPTGQNVMFTFFFALLALAVMEKLRPVRAEKPTQRVGKVALCSAIVAAAYWMGETVAVDYGGLGVVLVIGFYCVLQLPEHAGTKPLQVLLMALLIAYMSHELGGVSFALNGVKIRLQMLATFAVIPIALYLFTGEKKALNGRAHRIFKYIGYVFYPLHLVILYGIARLF